jgi:ABC-type antimicrobial peptide transport system permease subunit
VKTLVLRSLRYYWRTNAAVVAGTATAVAVLAGALLVGESVRGSLRAIALRQLGRTEQALQSNRFFREALAGEVAARGPSACPIVTLPAVVSHQGNGRRAGDVLVYGVDERFWSFQGRAAPPALSGRTVLLGRPLADELASAPGDTLVVRVPPASDIPGSSLFGRRDEPGRSLRVTVGDTLSADSLGEFTLRPQQQSVRAMFVSLRFLQRSLGLEGRVNTLLLAGGPSSAVSESLTVDDLGLRVRALLGPGALAVESTTALLDDDAANAAREATQALGFETTEVLVYLANEIRDGARTVPYSLVAALDPVALASLGGGTATDPPPILLNAWAAEDLGARLGDALSLSYYVWDESGRLLTRSAAFTMAGVAPARGLAADRELVPSYPGITESVHLADWDPPFPVDLSRIRPRDEQYWDRYRTTPKAFVSLAMGRELWGQRRGRLSSLRARPRPGSDLEATGRQLAQVLRARLDPAREGVGLRPVRAEALRASEGATDFGEYFVYFSFFLVLSALLLAGLFFRLGVEQRLREIGLLRAVGFGEARVRRAFLAEGLLLSAMGGVLGVGGAAFYASAVVLALRTIWVGAVGTRDLSLHVSASALGIGFAAGGLMAAATVAWTLRGLRRRSPRSLLSGDVDERSATAGRGCGLAAAGALASALALLAAGDAGRLPAVGAFFGTGALLLVAALTALAGFLGRPHHRTVRRLSGLGLRGATFRPGRSVLCVALVAASAFVIVAVGAFHREPGDPLDPKGESGGYTLLADSLLPLHHDPDRDEGRAALNLPADALKGVRIVPFRKRAGEDASCLNLYRPGDPTVVAPSREFVEANRFTFQDSLAATEAERADPWRLLLGPPRDGAIPVIADGGSMEYVLHKKLGDAMEVGGAPVVFVGALQPGLFSSTLVMGESNFQRAFPGEEGYGFFLIEAPPGREAAVTEALESRLSDFGVDVSATAERLRAFHRVENTYLATFQLLGGLGLLLGTVGLCAVMLRNAIERRRELALLQAVGYRRRHVSLMMLTENLLLLGLGLGIGASCALVALVPALRERPGTVPLLSLGALLLAVAGAGVLASRLGVAVVRRLSVVGSLRSE